jgi:hypothetical protein
MLSRSRHAIITAFTGTLLALAPLAAQAQKPALTANIDEKGFNPYYQLVTTSSLCSLGGGGDCIFDFDPVPAGYRLVVLHVYARYYIYDGTSAASNVADLGVEGTASGRTGNFSVAFSAPPAANTTVIFNYPVTFFVEPGKTPFVELENVFTGGVGNYIPRVVITGYLVNLNP